MTDKITIPKHNIAIKNTFKEVILPPLLQHIFGVLNCESSFSISFDNLWSEIISSLNLPDA